METHAHHLHKAPGNKWMHYLFEFLMLFLAVFCGFLAENIREHQLEHQREKQFAKQLLADLRADSTFFQRRVASIDKILEKHKQFYELMTSKVKPSDKQILNACLPLLYTFDLEATTATYNQMKASGSLRYIQNVHLTNVLQQYYEVLLPRASKGSDLESQNYSEIINPFILKHFRVQDFDFVSDSVKIARPVILNRTAQVDQELLNIVEGYAGFHKVIQERLTIPATKKVNELIGLLIKEYHLE